MEAYGPPKRAGVPEADAENQSYGSGGEESDGRFARIGAVTESEEEGKEQCAPPEAHAAGHGVLHVAAQEGFFEESGCKKDESPSGGILPSCRPMQGESVEGQQTGLPEHEDERGDGDEAPGQS